MSKNKTDWINEVWNTELYQQLKRENFELVDKYLPSAPLKILDIGCGLAWESRLFNEKYGTELWLLDGDNNDNSKKPEYSSDTSWHNTADDFLYYHPLEKLKSELDTLETKNYHLVDCNNINIPSDIKFDLITSWVSCGFHYPVNTYKDLILKHSHENTVVVMDIRRKRKSFNLDIDEGVEILEILNTRQKYNTSVLKIS